MNYSMICYTVPMNDAERETLHKYWQLGEEFPAKFKYPAKELTASRGGDQRNIYSLIKEPSFALDFPSFICSSCSARIPAKNRAEVIERLKDQDYGMCLACETEMRERAEKRNRTTIQKFKDKVFPAVGYLDSLNYEESLCLLALVSDKEKGEIFLADSPAEISITCSETIDQQILNSLINVQALTHISKLPSEVENAYLSTRGDFRRLSYYKASGSNSMTKRYRRNDFITEGVYINLPVLDGGIRATHLHEILYMKIMNWQISVGDIHKIQRIVRGIQFAKLYQLIATVSREFQIEVADSNVLRALLDAVSEKYAPDKLYFTFRMKAKDVVVYMHQNGSNVYAERNYLAKFVSNYIQLAEDKGYGLQRSWSIPPDIEISPFEAIFSQLYLDGEFNFNRLSSKAIAAKWLEKVELLSGEPPPSLSN